MLIGLIVGIALRPRQTEDDGRILKNVCAGDVNLGGMTRDEAKSALRLATDNTFTRKDMVIRLPDATFTLSPADTGAVLDVEAVVEAAYRYGRSGTDAENKAARENAATTVHTIALLPYLNLDLPYIQRAIRDFCNSYSSEMTPPTVTLNGERPTFDPEYPDLEVIHQTLVITMGTPDYELDSTTLYDRVLDAYSLNQLELVYKAPTRTEPERPDAAALFQELCVSPADATIDEVTFVVTPEVYGYGFNVAELQRLIDEAEYGQTVQVPLGFLMPKVTAEDLSGELFLDLLSSYVSVNQSNNTHERNVNLLMACNTINGIVLKPGDEFSFNQLLGRPTAEKGYKKAPDFRNGEEVEILGGGISQVASALYYSALKADLEILERTNHGYLVDFVPLGTDAYVAYNAADLRFRNNTGSPIRILASAEGNKVTIQLLGNDELDYDIQIQHTVLKEDAPLVITQTMTADNVMGYKDGDILQAGITGYEIETYLCKFDKLTGEPIDKILVNESSYSKRDQIVVKIGSNDDIPTQPTDPSTDPTEPSVDPTLPAESTEPTVNGTL